MSALDAIPPADLTYGEWTAVGMALRDAGADCGVWEAWSTRDPGRYHKNECARKWATFRGAARPVTQNTIFKMARDRGWQPPDTGGALGWEDTIRRDGAAPPAPRTPAQSAPPAEEETAGLPAPEPVPEPDTWDPARQLTDYLAALFDASEHVGYVTGCWQRDGRFFPREGCWDRTAGQLIEALAACGGDLGKVLGDYDPAAGAWIRANPLDGAGCKDDNVTDLRYALVESDEIDIGVQLAIIRRLELPCAALVHSGNRSLHAIVRVDAPNREEYNRRVDFLYGVCRKNGLVPDQNCRNPSRLSRMPGAVRGEKKQYLLGTNLGKSSWSEWQAWIAGEADDLPAAENLADVWAHLPPLRPPLIEGVLRRGHKLLLAGPSKAGKSYALIELCIAIAEGGTWLGRFPCAGGRVLYINLELDRASCLHRFADVYAALGIADGHHPGNIDIWNLRGASVPMDRLAPRLIRRAQKKEYLAVVLDPIYKVITGDENSADQMARFCNQFDLVCRELQCAVIYCHHHSKGAQGAKRSMDRASGSGVFARDPDALLDLIELVPTDAIREQLAVRAACGVCREMLDSRGLSDAYGPDDACSRARMRDICAEHFGAADLGALDAAIAATEAAAARRTAWRIEGTLREFERFEPVNLWFDYPIHRLEPSLLDDLVPESDARALGFAGAQKRWKRETPSSQREKSAKALETAFEACTMDGEVTVYAMAQYMDLRPRTVKERLKKDGRFWIEGEKIGRKEPGHRG